MCTLPAFSLYAGGGPNLFGTLSRLCFYIFATFLTVVVRIGTRWTGFKS